MAKPSDKVSSSAKDLDSADLCAGESSGRPEQPEEPGGTTGSPVEGSEDVMAEGQCCCFSCIVFVYLLCKLSSNYNYSTRLPYR